MTGYEYQRPRTPRTGPRYVATEQHARIVGAWTRKTHDAERVARTWAAAARRAETAAKMNRARVRHLLEQLRVERERDQQTTEGPGLWERLADESAAKARHAAAARRAQTAATVNRARVRHLLKRLHTTGDILRSERHEWERHANSLATRVAHLQEELAQERRRLTAATRDAKHWQARCREENARAQEYLEKLTAAAQGTRHPAAPQDPQAPAPVREQLVVLEQRVAQLTGALGDAMVIARDAVNRAREHEQTIRDLHEAHATQAAMHRMHEQGTPHPHDDREQEQ